VDKFCDITEAVLFVEWGEKGGHLGVVMIFPTLSFSCIDSSLSFLFNFLHEACICHWRANTTGGSKNVCFCSIFTFSSVHV
jgi:hypothetical protein